MSDMIYRHGHPLMIDYTPAADHTAGDVIVIQDDCFIVHTDIENGVGAVGALAAPHGSAVYEGPKNTDDAFADNDPVFWDAGEEEMVNDSEGGEHKYIGRAVGAATAAATTMFVCHDREEQGDNFIPSGTQQSVTAAGAANLTSLLTTFDSTAGAMAVTLADGNRVGQLKELQLVVDNGDVTVTPENLSGGTTITFADVGDYALLRWDGSNWIPIKLTNVADGGATAPVLA